ncbi:MAG: hypothetical protein NTY22_04645 [Proteobacteria bacterium]|nr:hypothetical protein [Pseudomonadota bacterium]
MKSIKLFCLFILITTVFACGGGNNEPSLSLETQSNTYNVRDTGPAGGLIFYVDSTQEHGLETAPNDQSSGIRWHNGSYTTTGANAVAVGTGQANTTTIVASQGAGSYAASLCDNLTTSNDGVLYSDWFLPSYDELLRMHSNLFFGATPVGGFTNNYYWTSSEIDANSSFMLYFGSSSGNIGDKVSTYHVRCIRAF